MKRLIKGQLVIWVYKENILGIMLSAFLFGGVVACSDEQATEKQLTDESGLPEYPIPDRTTIVAFPGAYGAGKYTCLLYTSDAADEIERCRSRWSPRT